jgi:hypothetical protein
MATVEHWTLAATTTSPLSRSASKHLAQRIGIDLVDRERATDAQERGHLAGRGLLRQHPFASFVLAKHLDPGRTLRDEDILRERRDTAVVPELLASIVRLRGVREHLHEEDRVGGGVLVVRIDLQNSRPITKTESPPLPFGRGGLIT